MASRMLHYILAVEIAKIVEITDMNRFILGSLIPDASSHADGSYDVAHFSDKRICNGIWKKGMNWTLFENKYKKEIEEDSLYLGYLCHLIADAIWFHRIMDKYIRIYPKKERIRYIRKGYEDFQKLNGLLQEKYKLSCPSVPIPPVDMEEISSESVDSLMQEFYKDFEVTIPCDKSELEVYPYEAVLEFISEGISICVKEINALRNNEMGTEPFRYYVEPRP